MKRLEISVDADADLFDILSYGTAVHGEQASDAYYSSLIDAFSFLCRNAAAGQIDEDSALGLCWWHYRRHRIYYRIDDDALLIVRIFHVAADAVRWLRD